MSNSCTSLIPCFREVREVHSKGKVGCAAHLGPQASERPQASASVCDLVEDDGDDRGGNFVAKGDKFTGSRSVLNVLLMWSDLLNHILRLPGSS